MREIEREREAWTKIRAPYITFHALRHCHAALLASHADIAVVSKLLAMPR